MSSKKFTILVLATAAGLGILSIEPASAGDWGGGGGYGGNGGKTTTIPVPKCVPGANPTGNDKSRDI